MSAALLFDSIARIARHEASARPLASVGRVTGVFPNDGSAPDHAVSVQLRDSGIVLNRVPVAVGAMGFAAIPAVGDLVVVVLLEGDYHAPVVVGRLYHPDQDPPRHREGQLVLRLPSGAEAPDLECEIAGDPPGVKLTLPGGVRVELVGEKITLAVGEITVALDAAGGGRMELAAGGSTITLKKDGDVAVRSSGKLTLEGAEVEITGQSKVKITGATVEVN
jgi:phage baseplate assembly protein gpV